MVVRLNGLDPFTWLLFSQTGGKSCVTRGQRRTETELRILFEDNDVDRCGLTREADGSYSLVIVVQVNAELSLVEHILILIGADPPGDPEGGGQGLSAVLLL